MKKIVVTIGIISILIIIAIYHFEASRIVKISIVGDVLLDRGVRDVIQKHGPAFPYEKISSLLNQSDISIGNLECPVTNNGAPVLKRGNLIFRADPNNIPYLYNTGFRIFNLANNHSMDYGPNGLMDTIDLLNKQDILTFGAGSSQVKAQSPLYIQRNGITIGLLGFSAFPSEGYFYFENNPDVSHLDEKKLGNIIRSARKHCNILIVMFHWGKEFDFYPSEYQKTIGHLAISSGADIVIGHHPHVLQGVEKYKGKFIFYSLGNFIFDRQIPPGTDETGILQLTAARKGIENIVLTPVRIKNCQPAPCSNEDADYISSRLALYSKNLKAVLEHSSKKIIIQ